MLTPEPEVYGYANSVSADTASEFDAPVGSEGKVLATRGAALGAKKAAQGSVEADVIIGFAMTAKVPAGMDNLMVCRLFACVTLDNYESEIAASLVPPYSTSIVSKIAAGRKRMPANERRQLLVTTIRCLAQDSPCTFQNRWNEKGTLLNDWVLCLQKMPPSVKQVVGQSFWTNSRNRSINIVSNLAILALCEATATHDILQDLFGRIPAQFMRQIDDVVERHACTFQQSDVDTLIKTILTSQL